MSMLSALSIANIVIIDRLDIELSYGLSVFSGETGAGKSILLDALTLALGGRGDASLVSRGKKSGYVIAEIRLDKNHLANKILEEAGIEQNETLILKRIQYNDGRTRAFINDIAVSASFLRKIGSLIVEIHGQHDDRALIDVATHRRSLDEFGSLTDYCKKVEECFQNLQQAQSELDAHIIAISKAKKDEEFARHTVSELSELELKEGEEERLSEQRQRLMQLEKSVSEISEIDNILNSQTAPSAVLAALLRKISRKSQGENDIFLPIISELDSALLALDRANEALEALKYELNFDRQELENIEERLFTLRAIARKHNVEVEQLPKIMEKYQKELEQLEYGEEKLQGLEKNLEGAKKEYFELAAKLSKARGEAAKNLEKAVAKELPDLKLENAKFIVKHEIDNSKITPYGFDNISFFVQTNPGTNPGPILKTASGGELSRFLLALKVVLAQKSSAPILIFDEIDSGVGGAVADAIGQRLARLAQNLQVFSITHAPQIAARANNHLLIEKKSVDNGKNTRTYVKILDNNERREELARMLAGAKISDEARAAAMRLLEQI